MFLTPSFVPLPVTFPLGFGFSCPWVAGPSFRWSLLGITGASLPDSADRGTLLASAVDAGGVTCGAVEVRVCGCSGIVGMCAGGGSEDGFGRTAASFSPLVVSMAWSLFPPVLASSPPPAISCSSTVEVGVDPERREKIDDRCDDGFLPCNERFQTYGELSPSPSSN